MIKQIDINAVKTIADQAGQAILDIYRSSDFGIERKDDASPVTQADLKAHQIIESGLSKISPWPILSEESEGIDYATRSAWETFWLVDPLDGTKEFIAQNDEFTVNIALIHQGQPCFGLVGAPALDLMFWNDENHAYMQLKDNAPKVIQVRNLSETAIDIVASRRHGGDVVQVFQKIFPKVNAVAKGSSLKFCAVAEGLADAYPRVAPTSEWDTAAAQAVLEHAGGAVLNWSTGKPLEYNKESLLNPYFIAIGDVEKWKPFLESIFKASK